MHISDPVGVSSFARVDGLTLHFRRDGDWRAQEGASAGTDTSTPILYLHSLGADLTIFDRVVAALPHRAHLRQDLRGHGLSDAPAGPYTIAGLAADAVALLRANSPARAVLVGVSVGGMVALRAALDAPDVVAGLVLCDTAAKIGDQAMWQERVNTVVAHGVEAVADVTLQRWFPEQFRTARPELMAGLRNMLVCTRASGYAGTCHALATEDLRSRLHELRTPTMVVVGREDLSTPPPVVAALAEALPDSELQIIEGAGHLPMVDAPEEFTELLSGYLEDVSGGGSRA